MNILFTGSSSFTGYWFIKTLAEKGHTVVAAFSGSESGYNGIRAQRLQKLKPLCSPVFECAFGSDRFLGIVRDVSFDILCHHAAETTDYKSDDFDVVKAFSGNTRNLRSVLAMLQERGCSKVLLTGSVFEQKEGAGSDELRAFSPYGLSKGFTSEMFRYFAGATGLSMGKFVIPNPFGPYEEPRFTAYLVKSWFEGKTPQVLTPAYVRDNIHVSLLARAYRWFAETLTKDRCFRKFNPSGYPESQGAFARRFADEMRPRLGLPCRLEFAQQKEFPEPVARINTDPVAHLFPDWNEKTAWDEIAEYYRIR